MQVLDQQVTPPLTLPEQRLHLREGGGIDLPAFRMIRPAPPPRAGMNPAVVFQRRRHRPSPAPPSLRAHGSARRATRGQAPRSNLEPAVANRPEIASSPFGSSQ